MTIPNKHAYSTHHNRYHFSTFCKRLNWKANILQGLDKRIGQLKFHLQHISFKLPSKRHSKQIILKNRHSILESLWRPNYAVISNGLPHTDKLLSVCLTLIQGSTYKLEQQDRWLSDSPKKGNKKNPLSN